MNFIFFSFFVMVYISIYSTKAVFTISPMNKYFMKIGTREKNQDLQNSFHIQRNSINF